MIRHRVSETHEALLMVFAKTEILFCSQKVFGYDVKDDVNNQIMERQDMIGLLGKGQGS